MSILLFFNYQTNPVAAGVQGNHLHFIHFFSSMVQKKKIVRFRQNPDSPIVFFRFELLDTSINSHHFVMLSNLDHRW